jgi:putative transposase
MDVVNLYNRWLLIAIGVVVALSSLFRDRDQVYGHAFRQRVKGMQIREVLTAARCPWQNPFVERLIGSVRRECLDHVLVLSERHLQRILAGYFT